MNFTGIVNKYANNVTQGVATIKRVKIDEEHARFANTRILYGGGHWFERIHTGDYVQLYVNGQLMMSDTHMERITNEEFIENAYGRIMIAGLGLGLVLENLRNKIDSSEVTEIIVYEKYQDVIDLVAPRFNDLPLEVRLCDILKYKPSKDERYDTIYFDIWPSICLDNLAEINVLHQRWKNHKTKGGWMGSWMQDFLRKERRKESRW